MIVVWRVTERCNLACGFCAYDRTLSRSRVDADAQQIRHFGATLADYQQHTGDKVLVSWIGGEPLRWPALEQLTTLFRTEYGLRISTTTNGTPLESAVVRAHLLTHYAELTVSIDALGTSHDRLRGSPGLFSRVKSSVKQLTRERASHARRLKLRANVVLMRDTIGDFPALCAELGTWGFDEITFNSLGGRDRPEYFPTHRILPAQVEEFEQQLPALRAELSRNGVRLSGSAAYLERMHASSRDQALPVDDCEPGQTFLFVDELGRAAPCSFTAEDYGVSIDSLRTAGDLQRLPLTFSLARHEHRALSCDDCLSTHVFSKFAVAHG